MTRRWNLDWLARSEAIKSKLESMTSRLAIEARVLWKQLNRKLVWLLARIYWYGGNLLELVPGFTDEVEAIYNSLVDRERMKMNSGEKE